MTPFQQIFHFSFGSGKRVWAEKSSIRQKSQTFFLSNFFPLIFLEALPFLGQGLSLSPDMEKVADTRTLPADIFLIMENYAPLFSEENLFLVEMFEETFNIWHIYSL